MTSNTNDRTAASQRAAEDRTRIGNTPTCEDCGKDFDHCECEEEYDPNDREDGYTLGDDPR